MNENKLNELWIGDQLKIKSSGKVGVFAGKNRSGKARIKYGNKILLVNSHNLELIEDQDLFDPTPSDQKIEKLIGLEKTSFDTDELDLHINKLAPNLENQRAEMILHHQIRACKTFIEDAITQRKYSVIVIHGKGSGALKSEVNHLIKSYKEVYFSKDINNGGALDVIFQY